MQQWAGITTTTPLPAGTINVWGYLSHGTLSTGASMTLTGSGNELRVHDTLRIHGNLVNTQYAHLIIEAGGVLVVHGNYDQNDWARLTIRGKMIVLGELKLLGSTNATNTGSLYVGGSSSTGGWELNVKTLAALATEDPYTSYFVNTNVISSVCSGTNSGTLTYTGLGSIIRWESSTDHFKSNIQHIASTLTQHTYTNLTKTTTYRVYYNRGGVLGYSNGATIITESASAGGQISGPEEICGAVSSATFSLTNHTGAVLRWEWSTTSNFATGTVETKVTTDESLTLSGITDFTYVRAVVKNGNCSEVYSATHYLKAYPATNGGSISGPAVLCQGANSGTLTLGSHKGNVLRWERSSDNFATDIHPISSTSPELSITNLTATSWYRAVVKSGPCDMAYSQPLRVEVQELKGGTLTGPGRVCAGTNSGTVKLEGYSGTIIRGEWSNDGFQSHVQVAAYTQNTYTFSNLTQDTWFRAVVSNDCGQTYSTTHVVRADQPSLPGSLSGPSSVCKGTNAGTLSLSGHRGAIVRWEFSGDNFVNDRQTLAITGSAYSFTNLSADRWYRVVVQNESCAAVTSASFRVRVSELAGGTLSGPATLCQGAGGTLTLSGHLGSILRWESSTDNFASAPQAITTTASTHTFSSLGASTWFRAVVGNAECGQTYSASWKVEVEQPSLAGTLSGTQAVCAPTNTGTLQLQG
ncbi:hypothetical protein, partial [Cesiribacter andamanensis]|uniref:hypothetical protein n=1 Tax=Cesiribacter andamanensis TaxID=649507 RepID=UPI00058EC1B5